MKWPFWILFWFSLVSLPVMAETPWWQDEVVALNQIEPANLSDGEIAWHAWQRWDQWGLDWVQARTVPEAETFWTGVSHLGDPRVHAALSTAAFLIDSERNQGYLEAVGWTGIIVGLGKTYFGQARPYLGEGPVFRGPTLDSDYAAMPSAHTAINFAAAMYFSHRYPEYGPLFWTGAGLVSFSRLVLADHWPSNVLLGSLLGVLVGKIVVAAGS